jgi:cytochrome P450 family 628
MTVFGNLTARASAGLAGVALHLFAFRYGEWDNDTRKIIASWITSQLAGVVAARIFLPTEYDSFLLAAKDISILAWCATAGIYASMIIYRALFHRLNKFPGPFAARLSTFYVTSLSAKKFHLYEEVQALHQKYGDYVRLGMMLTKRFLSKPVADNPSAV